MKNAYERFFWDIGDSCKFSKMLKTFDIESFLKETYDITKCEIKQINYSFSGAPIFRVHGIYLESGFNNICFDGIFTAYDFRYEFGVLMKGHYYTKHTDEWKKFMFDKYGEEYFKYESTFA